MRPVNKGGWPQQDGQDRVFATYQDALPDLTARLGLYCSYCERRLPSGLAVEHKLPKSRPENEHLVRDWANFLLSCLICNAVKLNKPITDATIAGYFWPDVDNTALAFLYQEGGIVSVHPGLSMQHAQRAKATLELVGLDRHGAFPPFPSPTPRDSRWSQRREVWDIAVRARDNLLRRESLALRETIVELALAHGFWSVWMAVFRDDLDMRRQLLRAFPGTAVHYFDVEGGGGDTGVASL